MSDYFEFAMFHASNPVSDEHSNRKRAGVFQNDLLLSEIEVRFHTKIRLCDYVTSQHISVPSAESTHIEPNAIQGHLKIPCKLCDDSRNSSMNIVPGQTCITICAHMVQEHLDDTLQSSDQISNPWLIVKLDTSKAREFIKATRNDFRVFYLDQRHSFSRLQITADVFNILMTECEVFGRINSFLIGFCYMNNETEIGPPAIEYGLIKSARLNCHVGFECAYIIRYIELTKRPSRAPWSLRKYLVYHRFNSDPHDWVSTWLLVGASQRTKKCLEDYRSNISQIKLANPFELHLLFITVSIAAWRPYLADLLEDVAKLTSRAVVMMIGDEDHPDNFVSVNVDDHQQLTELEDQQADILICLDSTSDTISSLRLLCMSLPRVNWNESAENCGVVETSKSHTIEMAFTKAERQVQYTRKITQTLLSKIQNTRELISSLLERQNGYNLDQQMNALQNIERQAQVESTMMRQLAEKSSQESTSVRILTIIMLIYLPCTVVSSFYSTQFVNQKQDDTGVYSMEYTQNAWLFFAVSFPLTLFTIMIWYIWVNSRRMIQIFTIANVNRGASFVHHFQSSKSRKERPGLPR